MSNIQEAFASISSIPVRPGNGLNSELVENKYWSKWIPVANKLSLYGVLVMMFGVNLFILVINPLDLDTDIMVICYGIMLVPTAIFLSFYFYEKRILANKYRGSNSRLDPWLLALITIRNIAFVASVIPFVQIIGTLVLVFGCIPYLIAHFFMFGARNKSIATV